MESIENERSRSAVTYSMITAIQERCRLAEAPDGMTDNQLLTQTKKGSRRSYCFHFFSHWVAILYLTKSHRVSINRVQNDLDLSALNVSQMRKLSFDDVVL